MLPILKLEQIAKQYRLGKIGTGTLSQDLNSWWHTLRGKPNPYLKIGSHPDEFNKQPTHVWALKDISFEVQPGEVLGIIGMNGAGKSTLLKILSRVTTPTKGTIKSRGRIAALLEVGTGFNPELTGRENIFLNGAILGMTKREIKSKLNDIIAFSGCEKYIDTPTKRYSSGMNVRLGFAIAAFLEPEILVVDEVLAVGDVEFQKKALGKMQEVSQNQGRTVLFVSHDMTAIANICQNVVVMHQGKVSEKMSVNVGIHYYLNQFNNHKIISNRIKSSDYFIKNIQLNVDNNSVKKVFCGESFEISFQLNKILTPSEWTHLGFYVVIKNQLDMPVLTISNKYDHDFASQSTTTDMLTCNIDALTLTHGLYLCNIWINYKGIFMDEIIDAFQLQVLYNDFYKTGHLPVAKKHGHYLIQQSWRAKA